MIGVSGFARGEPLVDGLSDRPNPLLEPLYDLVLVKHSDHEAAGIDCKTQRKLFTKLLSSFSPTA